MALLRVRVHPSSKREAVIQGEVWEVYVKEPARNGRANARVIEILKTYFKRVRLVRGARSRLKVFEVEG